jgi:hypothetical protein
MVIAVAPLQGVDAASASAHRVVERVGFRSAVCLRNHGLRAEQIELMPAFPPLESDLLVSGLYDVAARAGCE